MINFVIKENRKPELIAKIKKLVMVSTSVILVIYIVVAGGVAGWTLWVSSRQKQNSAENTSLTQQINSLFDKEVVVRNLADRAKLVESYLKSRGNASDAADTVMNNGYKIVLWQYGAAGVATVGISASSAAQLRDYADYLGNNYDKIQTSKIEWQPEKGWEGTFIISGRKKT